MNKLKAILIFALFTFQSFGQDSTLVSTEFEIVESITTISKAELFLGWEKMTDDTINPTSIKIDINGDQKLDLVGFFTGIENGLFVFGNFEGKDGEAEQLYKLDFDETWFENDKFQAVIIPIQAGAEITDNETGEVIILGSDSALIRKSDASEVVLTWVDNNWLRIRTK